MTTPVSELTYSTINNAIKRLTRTIDAGVSSPARLAELEARLAELKVERRKREQDKKKSS